MAWVLCVRLVDEETDEIETLLPDLVQIVVQPYHEAGEPPSVPDSLPASRPLPTLAAARFS
ncbi:MAG: hypothetical protein WB507_04845 [Solirubrobacterales bacterium]